jgi:N-acetylmuramoyl-L-alanine amidase
MAVQAAVVEPAGAGARLVLDMTGDPKLAPFFIPGVKPRFVLDLQGARWNAVQKPVSGALVAALRHGAHEDKTRLVLDLNGDARLVSTRQTPTATGVRVVFELAPMGQPAGKMPVPAEPVMIATPAPKSMVQPAAAVQSARRLIVIDPGHGGKDSGALAKDGAMEKDFNLAAALTLRSALEKRGFEVVLTRETDEFLPLADRVKIARDRKADLFLSLHSDADPQAQAKGATVYTLSQRGAARAKALADTQDWGVEEASAQSRVGSILLDLTQRETTDHSAEFAETLLSRIEGVAPLTSTHARQAGFFVLLAPDVPAALLEMGFVTHAEDAKRLASPAQRKAMMDAVAASVDDYFSAEKSYAAVTR